MCGGKKTLPEGNNNNNNARYFIALAAVLIPTTLYDRAS